MRRHTQNGEWNKWKEIVLSVSEVEGELLPEMITDRIQFIVADRPFSRPILNPFLR